MTGTVYVVTGHASYHVDPDCKALDSAQIHGTVHLADHTDISVTGRPACIVCAADPNATEWTVTTANIGQLWELIEPSKPYVEFPADAEKPITTGLTIRPHRGLPKQRATFGDTIRHHAGRYTVHPATQETW